MSSAHTGREDGRPAMLFYVNDWLGAPDLRLVSLAARGVWIDLLCVMHTSKRRGYLEQNGKQLTSKEIAKLVGEPEDKVQTIVDELYSSGVFSKTESGTIYCRRMRRESELSRTRAEAGRKGGRTPKGQAKAKQTESKDVSKDVSKLEANHGMAWDGMASDNMEPRVQDTHDHLPVPPQTTDLFVKMWVTMMSKSASPKMRETFASVAKAGVSVEVVRSVLADARPDIAPWDLETAILDAAGLNKKPKRRIAPSTDPIYTTPGHF